jgi:hypothetical protein
VPLGRLEQQVHKASKESKVLQATQVLQELLQPLLRVPQLRVLQAVLLL